VHPTREGLPLSSSGSPTVHRVPVPGRRNGDLNNQDSLDVVIANLKKFGRTKTFDQNISANYTVPLDKFPLTNWLGAEYRYNVGYNWKAGPLETIDSLKLGTLYKTVRSRRSVAALIW
jgi:cell surface protein SprA